MDSDIEWDSDSYSEWDSDIEWNLDLDLKSEHECRPGNCRTGLSGGKLTNEYSILYT